MPSPDLITGEITETTTVPTDAAAAFTAMSPHDRAVIAYASVADIPALEMNDRHRLGFHIYLYLIGEMDTVLAAVRESRTRLGVNNADAAEKIVAALRAQGINAK